MPGDGALESGAATSPGDTRREGRPRFLKNTEKSKASCGNSGFKSHIPRSRSASPRTEKPEMPLYWLPRSDRPHAPINTRATKLSVWGGLPNERRVEFMLKNLGEVEKSRSPLTRPASSPWEPGTR